MNGFLGDEMTLMIERNYIEDRKMMLNPVMITEKKGKQIFEVICTENVVQILRTYRHIFGSFRYDDFKCIFEIRYSDKYREKDFEKAITPHQQKERIIEVHNATSYRIYDADIDPILIQTRLSRHFDFLSRVPEKMVQDAVKKLAMENRYDSAQDYVKSLKWDGEARLDTWLCNAYGVDDSQYHRAIGSNWLKGMISRIMFPGCKFDFVLILEGPQGAKKSMSLGALGKDWHTETTMSTDSKDFFQMLQGKTIVEFSEGATFSKTEEARMKAIITTQVDRYRPSFGRMTKDFPRRCIFAMTTNKDEYLRDDTGNRRWFPVRVVLPESNVEWIEKNREQIFAEAYHRVIELKETIWEIPKQDAEEQQKMRRVREANEDMVVDWYLGLDEYRKREGITIQEAHSEGVNGYMQGGIQKPMTMYESIQIATILKQALGLKKVRKSVRGFQTYRWYDEKSFAVNHAVDKAMEDAKVEETVEKPLENKAEIPF